MGHRDPLTRTHGEEPPQAGPSPQGWGAETPPTHTHSEEPPQVGPSPRQWGAAEGEPLGGTGASWNLATPQVQPSASCPRRGPGAGPELRAQRPGNPALRPQGKGAGPETQRGRAKIQRGAGPQPAPGRHSFVRRPGSSRPARRTDSQTDRQTDSHEGSRGTLETNRKVLSMSFRDHRLTSSDAGLGNLQGQAKLLLLLLLWGVALAQAEWCVGETHCCGEPELAQAGLQLSKDPGAMGSLRQGHLHGPLNTRAVSPWTYWQDCDSTRFPRCLWQAVCRQPHCVSLSPPHGPDRRGNSVPLHASVRVFYRRPCQGRPGTYYLEPGSYPQAVACLCVLPRS
ncbi:interleukin-25 [Carettochelys insculpta]|uniref:interleukin-25 n=1 Tax=Carettochelys insculpta TaxID=44489 RepID=UPI003EBC5475